MRSYYTIFQRGLIGCISINELKIRISLHPKVLSVFHLWVIAVPMDVKGCFIVVLICIFLLIIDAEYFFMCLSFVRFANIFSHSLSVYFFTLSQKSMNYRVFFNLRKTVYFCEFGIILNKSLSKSMSWKLSLVFRIVTSFSSCTYVFHPF